MDISNPQILPNTTPNNIEPFADVNSEKETPIKVKNKKDEFLSSKIQKVDILFVIDNSGSMKINQDNLKSNLETFINQFVYMNLDFRLGAITTDNSKLDPYNKISHLQSGKRYLDKSLYLNMEKQTFINHFKTMVNVGISGSGTERGITKSMEALQNAQTLGNPNYGFIRNDAFLYIIYLSDEDESCITSSKFSDPNLCRYAILHHFDARLNSYYQTGTKLEKLLKDLETVTVNLGKSAPASLKVDSIVHRSVDEASDDTNIAGLAYLQAASKFGGTSYPLSGNFSEHLKEIGDMVSVINLFKLNETPAFSGSIVVRIEDNIIPSDNINGYTYDPISQSISFNGAAYQMLISQDEQKVVVIYSVLDLDE